MTEASADQLKKKAKRTSTACEACRRKRAKCDGAKPRCHACTVSNVQCTYDLSSDKRKPFTRDVVQAMQMRIDSLESELAQLHLAQGSQLPAGVQFYGGSSLSTRNIPTDAFQGGLAFNTHGELRFAGPTSSYRAVLADSSKLKESNVEAARAFSLTRAPIPGALPQEPALPRRPPDLALETRTHILRLAFEYGLHFGLVNERRFYRDLAISPHHRTPDYSPFLLNVLLAIGSRYLNPAVDNFPREICSDLNDVSTRGDVFINWARYMIDAEYYHPDLSTVQALGLLALYLAAQGLDGPAYQFLKQSLALTEDFGLDLGLHRLAMGSGGIRDEVVSARRDTFYAAFQTDVILSMYIGRSTTFSYEDVDQTIPEIDHETEYDVPAHRSSAFHNATKLILIASKMMNTVYALKPNIALASRQAAVPELHLQLETWYHDLASPLRAATTTASKAPHPLVIGLNLLYHMIMITLHRPFFRRTAPDSATSLSTEKCLSSAKHVVRLIELQKRAHTLRFVMPVFQHAAFCSGTILALSAVEDGITSEKDSERRQQAQTDLRSVVAALREVGCTWKTAHVSADVLEALMGQWAQSTTRNGASTNGGGTGTATPTTQMSAVLGEGFGVGADGLSDTFFQFLPDSSAAMSFPFLFPSWDLPHDFSTSAEDFLNILQPDPTTILDPNQLPFLGDIKPFEQQQQQQIDSALPFDFSADAGSHSQ